MSKRADDNWGMAWSMEKEMECGTVQSTAAPVPVDINSDKLPF